MKTSPYGKCPTSIEVFTSPKIEKFYQISISIDSARFLASKLSKNARFQRFRGHFSKLSTQIYEKHASVVPSEVREKFAHSLTSIKKIELVATQIPIKKAC